MTTTRPERKPRPKPAEQQATDPLDEVYRQLVAIHSALAVASDVDHELQSRTLQRLMALMTFVDGASRPSQPAQA